MAEQVKWNWGFLVREENRDRQRKTSWSNVEKYPTSTHMTSSLQSSLRHHCLLVGTWKVGLLITMTAQFHREHVPWEGPVQENVLYPLCWWCRCFRAYVCWCFFLSYFCPWRSLRSNWISKIERNAFSFSRNLIYLWVEIHLEQLLLLSFLSL